MITISFRFIQIKTKNIFASHFMAICEIAMCNIYSTLIVPCGVNDTL